MNEDFLLNFYTDDIEFNFSKIEILKKILSHIQHIEQVLLHKINYIFTSDTNILRINKQFLNHDYFTDIITFDYSDSESVSGDMFISIETVNSNAQQYEVSFENELFRVLIHGVLHLIGYDDKTEEEITIMRKKENDYLSLI